MTRHTFATLLLSAVVCLAEDSAVDDLASGYPLERYQQILEKSPFAKETVAPPTEQGDPFGSEFAIVAHYQVGEETFVVLLNRKSQLSITARSSETDASRIKIVSLQADQDPRKGSAVIQQHGRTATVFFDKNEGISGSKKPDQPASVGGPPSSPENPAPAGEKKSPSVLPRIRYDR